MTRPLYEGDSSSPGASWSKALRALREARGITRRVWADRLGYGRTTVQRWETGETIPDAQAEQALIRLCEELQLFQRYDQGPLSGVRVTPDWLRGLFAAGRLQAAQRRDASGFSSAVDALPVRSGEPAARLTVSSPTRPLLALSPASRPTEERREASGDSPARPASTLPAALTSFVGRAQELAEVAHVLTTTRILTLTGPGGVGKTRLAVEAARSVAPHFASGVCFVDLAPLTDAALAPARIAHCLGVPSAEGQDPMSSLSAFLHDRDLLLVLDNFEQVVNAAPQVAELVAGSRYVQALITSRVVLRVRGEQEFVVPPLVPPAVDGSASVETVLGNAAVQLFAQRARTASPGFALSSFNARPVAAICHRLDGLPLAIELAAARIKVLSPQAMLARLEHRLPLLTGGARDLPARQQTLRTTIAWSYNLLEPAEKTLFQRLAVFSGGWTLAAAEDICRPPDWADVDVVDGTASLVEKSLVRQDMQPDGEPRFSMLETIREYALERLAESGEERSLRHQHAAWYGDLGGIL